MLVSLATSLSKYCLLPKGEKIGLRRPNEPLAGHGASGTYFFYRQGLLASLTQTLKNEEHSRALPQVLFFSFLKYVWLLFSFVSLPPFSFFKLYSHFSDQESLFRKFLCRNKYDIRLVNHKTSKIL